MMTVYKIIISLISILLGLLCSAQNAINGQVTDKHGLPLAGANVYLSGTYGGAMTDEEGRALLAAFNFPFRRN